MITRHMIYSSYVTLMLCVFTYPCSSVAGGRVGIPGDVTVVGLFEVQQPAAGGTCGLVVVNSVMAVEAIKWYIGMVNDDAGLPFTVGFEAIKTCRVDGVAGAASVTITNRVLHNTTGDIIVGVIGPEHSSEAETVSSVLSSVPPDDQLLQMSYSGTADSLNNRTLYPNIYRVIPGDDTQIDVMLQTMVTLNWNRVAVIYEENTHYRARANSFRARVVAEEMCVSLMRAVSIDDSGDVNIVQLQSIMNDIVYGTTMDGTIMHPAEGVVIFASASTTNYILIVTNAMGVTDVPLFLLSAETHLQQDVFELNGQILQKAKGSLIVSPTYREITEFAVYWRSLFTNSTVFKREVLTNSWLQDVYDDIIGCLAQPCEFGPVTPDIVDTRLSKQHVSISYAVTAIHAVIKAAATVHADLCSLGDGMCAAFRQDFTPLLLTQAMNGMQVDMSGDFSLSPSSTVDIPVSSFGASGDLVVPSDTPSYQLYNYQRVPFGITKVGDYIDGALTVDKALIRDYEADERERMWPDIRKPQCTPGLKCSECIRHMAEKYWHIPGDVYVVGLVPVYDSQLVGCGGVRLVNGYQIAETVVFAVNTFNDNNGIYSSYFKNVKIGVIILNECSNPVVAERKILNLNKYGLPLDSGEMLDLTGKIVGYVGAVSSDISIAASLVLNPLKHVQISYSATSARLSDRKEHPYFMRVVTPDSTQAKAMMLLVKELNGEYIQVIYTQGAYGEGGKDQVVIQAKAMKVCVANTIMVPESTTDDYNGYYDQLRKYPFAKLVIVFVQSWIARPFVYDLVHQMKRGDFQFIGSQSWGKQPMVLSDDIDQDLHGSFTMALEIAQDQSLLNHLRTMKQVPYAVSPWANTYLQTLLGCYFPKSFDKSFGDECTDADLIAIDPSFRPDPWTSPAYNAVLSLLIGSGSFFRRVCGDAATSLCSAFLSNPEGLVNETASKVKLDIHGDGNPVKVFDDNGDGTVGYNVYNVQRDPDHPQTLVYRKVGEYVKGLVLRKEDIVYPVDELYESQCPNEQACAECLDDGGSTETGSGTKDVGMIVLGALLAVAVVAIVMLSIILWRKLSKTDTNIYNPIPDRETWGGAHGDTWWLPRTPWLRD